MIVNNEIEYKKRDINMRLRFSIDIRKRGVGMIPIVIETKEEMFREIVNVNKELEIYMDNDILHIRNIVNSRIMKQNKEIMNYNLTLENGEILQDSEILWDIYKKYRGEDKILYILISKSSVIWNTWNMIKRMINYIR